MLRGLRRACFFVSLVAFATRAIAGTPSAKPPALVAIKAGQLLDVKAGTLRSNQVILIAGERIQEIGSNVEIPVGASVIDLSGATVVPGLVDCHTHLLSNDSGALSEDDNHILTVTKMSTAKRALLGAFNAKGALDAGFTTVRDLGNSGRQGDAALRDAIDAGWVAGPRIVATTRALSAIGGQFGSLTPTAQDLIADEYVTINGVVDARRAVRQAIYDGADAIKIIVDTPPRILSPDEIAAIVDEAHRAKRKVAAHALTEEAIRLAAEAGVDSIEHAYDATESVLRIMAKKKVVLVPTDLLYETAEEIFIKPRALSKEQAARASAQINAEIDKRKKRLALAVKVGVRIVAGSDIYYDTPGRTRGHFSVALLKALHQEGMSPIEVLRSATSRAAELLGWQDRIGSLEPGRFADVIAVQGDPLADLGALDHVVFVMKGGVVVRNEAATH